MGDTVFNNLENDEIYRRFIEDEFDAKTYATRIIQSHAISQHLAKLAEGINMLDKEIHSQVVSHYEDLLSQATGIETLEGVLQMMQTRIQSLLTAIERIRSRVVDPYNKIVTRTAQLKRLQETCDTLRHIIRIMYLSKRLHGQLQGGAKEITKAAQTLNELDYLSNGIDLSGIEVVESDRRFIRQAHKDVETQAQKMLERGIEIQNQTQVATALQVFYNLNSLEETVDGIMSSCQDNLHKSILTALDVNILNLHSSVTDRKGGPGRAAGISTTGNTASFRASLWTNMEKLANSVYSSYSQTLHLQKVLVRKRDAATHALFIEHMNQNKEGSVNLLQDFWKSVTKNLTEEFNRTADNNSFLKQALEGEYPKLLRLYTDLWKRILSLGVKVDLPSSLQVEESIPLDIQHQHLMDQTALDANYDPEKALRDCLLQFETAYLGKSLSRLFDPINLVFSSNSSNPPTDEEIDGIVKAIASELNVASFDVKLMSTIARNVAKTIVFFCTKSEQLLVTDSDGSQVIGPPTSGQIRNAAVVNSLFKLHQSLSKVFSGLTGFPDAALTSFNEALQGIVELMGNAIQPLLNSISDALEDIILTIHNEDFSQSNDGNLNSDSPQCSLYMKELQQFISRVASTYLAQFHCTDFIMQSVRPMASQCLELFVRHSSLIYPLGEAGKLRLTADYAQMEMAISPLCTKLTDLGRSYRQIRAIRPLLFQTPEHISQSTAIGDLIPYSLILQFLFSRGYPALKPPYQAAGWTCQRYSQWLDEHQTERDRLKFIKGSLESYAQSVTSKGGKEFVPVYPIMLELLQKGLQHE